MVKYYSIVVGLVISFFSSSYAGDNVTSVQRLAQQQFLFYCFGYMTVAGDLFIRHHLMDNPLREARFPIRRNAQQIEEVQEQFLFEHIKHTKQKKQYFSKNNNREDRPKHAQINKRVQQYQGRANRCTRRSK